MTLNVGNCPVCGKIFSKVNRTVCPACYKHIEEQFVLCEKYLRDHRGATLQNLCDATGVTIKMITRFIKEGRISVYNAPNVQIPCDLCGQPMKAGVMCEACRQRLTHDLTTAAKEESIKIEESRRTVGFQVKKDGRQL